MAGDFEIERRPRRSIAPNLKVERQLLAEGADVVFGCDEVGRGAIAGPVVVGLVVIDERHRRNPPGLRDSKLLSEVAREALFPRLSTWLRTWAVGEANSSEIDQYGIMVALGFAGARAWQLIMNNASAEERVIYRGAPLVLDGNYDWLSTAIANEARVQTRIKADLVCTSVAAASVLAKVHRDRFMRVAHELKPGYGWDRNKGYSTRGHFAALAEHGATELHRHSWLRSERSGRGSSALFDLA